MSVFEFESVPVPVFESVFLPPFQSPSLAIGRRGSQQFEAAVAWQLDFRACLSRVQRT